MRFVPVESLEPGMKLAKDIINTANTFMLKKGVTLSDKYIIYLMKFGYLGAYIDDEFSEGIEVADSLEPELFYNGINAIAEGNIGSIMNIATEMVVSISNREEIKLDMFDLRSYDDYTYHHSVNVAVYCAAVGKKMGLSESDLEKLTIAALCHDLGKSKIMLEILNKPERLTDEEFELVKKHPEFSYELLYNNNAIPSVVRQAVVCHHENENGSGYPFGKEGDEIPLFAKIIHAVDVYDALTSKRPYKEPYRPADALEYLEGGKGILFNAEIVEIVKQVIPAYPPGINVVLSNGEAGIVAAHSADARRPIIKLYGSNRYANLDVDDSYKDVFIISSGVAEQDYVKEVEALNEHRFDEVVKKKKIMIVDDSPISIMQAKAALPDKYELITFNSGMECQKYINQNGAPDLILMDIEMPIVNGTMVVKSLRDKGYKDLPVIFLTAICDKETVIRCRLLRAVDYIVKPFNATYLKERVEIALDKNVDR